MADEPAAVTSNKSALNCHQDSSRRDNLRRHQPSPLPAAPVKTPLPPIAAPCSNNADIRMKLAGDNQIIQTTRLFNPFYRKMMDSLESIPGIPTARSRETNPPFLS
ncbi:uncharacterized protein LOC107854531 [Capsicum annuum]|uniref:uncharacterized protein LOC107854531 n=1 Tax=Capsicum annuum TaxID=4072 RepID=UPI001FB14B88|nr:uncharacterized protein LOC107854531 [Capsicum annuum]